MHICVKAIGEEISCEEGAHVIMRANNILHVCGESEPGDAGGWWCLVTEPWDQQS